MNKTQKTLRKIRAAEAELAYASPKRAAALTTLIVRLKADIFKRVNGK